MKVLNAGIAILFLSFGLVGPLIAQIELEADAAMVKKYMETITAEEMKEHLYIIASDNFEGRETGTLGQKLAADYIARHFMDNGLVGPVEGNPNPYFQPIPFYGRTVENVRLSSSSGPLTIGEDFISRSVSDVSYENIDVVFAGYGIETDTYNDFAEIDVKDKGVVIINGTPKNKKGEEILEEVPNSWMRMRKLMQMEVKFVILAEETQELADNRLSMWTPGSSKPRLSLTKNNNRASQTPILYMGPEGVAKFFGIELDDYNKVLAKAAKKSQSPSGAFMTKASLSFNLSDREVTSENVLGFMEGTDLKDEIVVITAHYDHVGRSGEEINNGADDDGSGTTGVLEIVNAFAQAVKDGNRPRRSILFMTVTGEEKGLLGSDYYSKNPIFPLENTVTDLNIDMIGRVDPEHEENPNFVYIIGSNMLSTDLDNIHKAVSSKFVPNLTMDYKYNTKDDPQRFYYRSDHYNFAKHNIPIIFYFNGTHADYHRPSDTPDKIEYEIMAERAKLVFATAWEIANRDKRPVVDKAEENNDR